MSFSFISQLNPFARTTIPDIEDPRDEVPMETMPSTAFETLQEVGYPLASSPLLVPLRMWAYQGLKIG